MKIYLDDERTPSDDWTLVRSNEEFIKLVTETIEKNIPIEAISFDFVLSYFDTAYESMQWLIEQEKNNKINLRNTEISYHSSSYSGRETLRKMWDEHNSQFA